MIRTFAASEADQLNVEHTKNKFNQFLSMTAASIWRENYFVAQVDKLPNSSQD
jgi:hypothetical protein